MVDGVEVEALFQDRFQRFQEVVFTFPDLAAAQADEMMMEMAFIVAVIQFIALQPSSKSSFFKRSIWVNRSSVR